MSACIHGEIGEFIGFFVEFPADVGNRKAGNESYPALSTLIERADVFVLDLVLSLDLLYDEFGISINVELLATAEHGISESRQESGIFREVVRSDSKKLGDADNSGKVNTNPGIARIPPRPPVDIGLQLHAWFQATSKG
jgi:hypothetical protein